MAVAELKTILLTQEASRDEEKSKNVASNRPLHLGNHFEDDRGFYFVTEKGTKARPIDLVNGRIKVIDSGLVRKRAEARGRK